MGMLKQGKNAAIGHALAWLYYVPHPLSIAVVSFFMILLASGALMANSATLTKFALEMMWTDGLHAENCSQQMFSVPRCELFGESSDPLLVDMIAVVLPQQSERIKTASFGTMIAWGIVLILVLFWMPAKICIRWAYKHLYGPYSADEEKMFAADSVIARKIITILHMLLLCFSFGVACFESALSARDLLRYRRDAIGMMDMNLRQRLSCMFLSYFIAAIVTGILTLLFFVIMCCSPLIANAARKTSNRKSIV